MVVGGWLVKGEDALCYNVMDASREVVVRGDIIPKTLSFSPCSDQLALLFAVMLILASVSLSVIFVTKTIRGCHTITMQSFFSSPLMF